MARKENPIVASYREAFEVSLDYSKEAWDTAISLYELFKLQKFPSLLKTISRLSINLHHAMVQDRASKIHQNVFTDKRMVSLISATPEAEPYRVLNEMWLRDCLTRQSNIVYNGIATAQMALIMGTSYRMPKVCQMLRNGRVENVISSVPLNYFSFVPGPTGGHANPFDKYADSSLDFGFFIEWQTEDHIKKLAKDGIYNKTEVGAMLEKNLNQGDWPETAYRNRFDYANGVSYGGAAGYRSQLSRIKNVPMRRRVVHWYTRDAHYIIGEDAFLLYESDPQVRDRYGNGIIPVAKYVTCPDGDNWHGIPFLKVVDDIVKAIIMNANFRHDNLLSTMFPQTWIREDILQNKPLSAFRRTPNAMHKFPRGVDDIQKAIYYDQGKDVPQQAFIDEGSMKAFLQKVAGASETTSSLNDVVGNKTATGVTAIMNELSGRPNMESIAMEQEGLRDECLILLALHNEFKGDEEYMRAPESMDNFPWATLHSEEIMNEYEVETHGTRYLAEKNINFQKLLAWLPIANNSPVWDQYELQKQAAEIADVLPDMERALAPQQVAAPMGGQQAGRPGGAASMMDMGQQIESRAREVPAGEAY